MTRITDKELLSGNQQFCNIQSICAMLENRHRSVEEIRFEAYKRAVGGHYMPEASFEVAFGQQAGAITTDIRAFTFGASPGGGLFGASTNPHGFGGPLSVFAAATDIPFEMTEAPARAEGRAAFRYARREPISRVVALTRDTAEGAAFASTLPCTAGGERFGVGDAPAVNALGTPTIASETGGSEVSTDLERRYHPLVEGTPMSAGSASTLSSLLKRRRPPHKSSKGNMTLPQGRASAASGSGGISRQVAQAQAEGAMMLTGSAARVLKLERTLVRAESQAATAETEIAVKMILVVA